MAGLGRTAKVVVIGDSGVGKTSLRGQYVEGRFSSGYRATIGADFITKTLPHPYRQDEHVTLQIWDTAGQERFSSLAAAFFRGADAAVLMFDAAKPVTLKSLERWWGAFCERVPVADEDARAFPCVVVGNKMDLLEREGEVEQERIEELERDARAAVERLFSSSTTTQPIAPPDSSSQPPPPRTPPLRSQATLPRRGVHRSHPSFSSALSFTTAATSPPVPSPTAPRSIAIRKSGALRGSRSRSRSRSAFAAGTVGTAGTATLSIYHTPSSSLWGGSSEGGYESARDGSPSPSPSTLLDGARRAASRARTLSALSAADVPEEADARTAAAAAAAGARGPALVFASAKSGVGVPDVFAAVAARVVRRWEEEDAREARRMSVWDGGAPVLSLREERKRTLLGCCAT